MSFGRTDSSQVMDEQDLCKRLYRRSRDITEYMSEEEKAEMNKLLQKYPDVREQVDTDMNALQRSESYTSKGLSTSASIAASFFRQKDMSSGEEKVGFYAISKDLLYYGEMKDGIPHGEGEVVCINTNTVVYKGHMENGLYNGKGCLYRDGFLYENGLFKDGHIKEGVRYNANGTIYSGTFEQDLFHNEGRVVFVNGFYYKTKFNKGAIADRVVEIASPSARTPSSVPAAHIEVRDDCLIYNQGSYCTVFYVNGDIFCGKLEAPMDGYLYRFNKNTFVTLKMGSAKGIPVQHPAVEILEGGKYKTFMM